MTLLHQAAQKAVEAWEAKALSLLNSYGHYIRQIANGRAAEMSDQFRDHLKAHPALQQQPEPVARSAHMCGMQGFDGMLDICPACEARRTPPALQHQEVPREPVADLLRGLVNHWNEFGPEHGLDEMMDAAHRYLAASPSTTRQQEVGSDAVALLRDIVTLSSGPGFHAAWSRAKELVASAPSTPEKAGGVSDGVGTCEAPSTKGGA